jgi:Ran GTPase-activating protein (RanGAP) involved in mRNA processing and transport
VDLTGLDTVLQGETSKITELDIDRLYGNLHVSIRGLTCVLRALACRSMLTKLGLRNCPLGRDEAGLLRMALCNIPSLTGLNLGNSALGSDELAELAPAFYCNTSIKVLDISSNNLNELESTDILRGIICRNKTITTLLLTKNPFGQTTGAVDCLADGLGSNSTLLNIDLSSCALRDGGVSILAQTLGSRNTTIKKLTLDFDFISSAGVGVLLDTSGHITDLDLQNNPIGNDGASLLARSLESSALPNLTRLRLSDYSIGDDGFIALILALKQNTSLLHLHLRSDTGFNERAYGVLAESLPEIKVLQRVDLTYSQGLSSAIPSLLAGLRKNTSFFRFHVIGCPPSSFPPIPNASTKYAGGWMQEMERWGNETAFAL